MQKLETLNAATPPPTWPERIITATAPGDFHTFSPLLLTFMLRRRGLEVVCLGAEYIVGRPRAGQTQTRGNPAPAHLGRDAGEDRCSAG
jgi:hypothetical protein